jgi:hypothetical protein
MNEFEQPHRTEGVCLCAQCYLISCGAIDADWDGWPWCWLAGEGRVSMMLLTGQPPVRYTYPQQDWAGAIPWFDRAGVGLVFDEDDEDEDDESLA